jgi:hypothetical protein
MRRTLVLVLAITAAGGFATAGPASSTERSGALHVTKECSQYDFTAGSFCTITSSNIQAIRAGMRVVYRSALGDPTPGVLDSDFVIEAAGHNTAYGHVVLDPATLSGVVTLSGGTGTFTHLNTEPLTVACPAYPNCSWDGAYSFNPPAHD